MVYEVTDDTFEELVVRSDLPCVIEFTGSWCPMCDHMAPVLEELSDRMADEVRFCTVNVDEQRRLRIAFAVVSLPYIVYVDHGTKAPLFDALVGADRLAERIRYMLDGGTAPGTTPLKPLS